jgi:U3 small nucleolar RNA-associated protein 10
MKSRNECALIRLATLKTIEKCYQIIGDEFLAMLPESIPFLAEMMDDTDPQVEKTCHQVIKQIEEISGESLDQYLVT